MVDVQQWLDVKYPKDKGSQITKLDIKFKALENCLNLEGFVNLKKLDCSGNYLSDLNINSCSNLEELHCADNFLTRVDFLLQLPCPEKLTYLSLSNNDFAQQNLSFLSRFDNLETIYLRNSDNTKDKKIQRYHFNRFYGSLAHLRNMKKLVTLDISSSDINSDLEYLPESLKYFFCSTKSRPQSRVLEIKKQLKPYKKNFQVWRLANLELISRVDINLIIEVAPQPPAPIRGGCFWTLAGFTILKFFLSLAGPSL